MSILLIYRACKEQANSCSWAVHALSSRVSVDHAEKGDM